VEDYEAFINGGSNRSWPNPGFPQEDDHPAVNMSWDDMVAFCDWLTEYDRKKGKLGEGERYRLPTDHEWSCAVGLGREEDADLLPIAKSGKIADIYPWGGKWPPPKGAGNYYGEETAKNPLSRRNFQPIAGYDDGFGLTAPVGSFEANEHGLYDMGGNVWERCEDWYSSARQGHVLRGASWVDRESARLFSSFRHRWKSPHGSVGFRVVIAGGGG